MCYGQGMKDRVMKIGIVGAVVSALCCFTPLLPWLFGAVGLSGALGYVYRDDVLLPILAISLIMIGLAIWWKKRAP